MKRIYLALLLAGTVACGGGGGSDPVAPPTNQNPPLTVASGQFTVTATMSINQCGRSEVWDGPYDIAFDGKTFTMGEWTGTWDGSSRLAKGESPHAVHTIRSCTITDYTAIYLTFSNKDTFHGTVIYRHRIAGTCTTQTACSTTWIVNGTRVPTP